MLPTQFIISTLIICKQFTINQDINNDLQKEKQYSQTTLKQYKHYK